MKAKNHYKPELDADSQIEDLESVDLNSEADPTSVTGWRILQASVVIVTIALLFSIF